MTDVNPRAVMGGNNPPPEEFGDLLNELWAVQAPIKARFDELQQTADGIPSEILDEQTAKVATDALKMFKENIKRAEEARKAAGKPFDNKKKFVDSFFKNAMEGPGKVAASLQSRLNAYLQKKEDEERRRRQREADELRAKAQAALEEAEKLSEQLVKATEAAEEARARLENALKTRAEVTAAGNEARSRVDRAKADAREARQSNDPAKLSAAIAARGRAEADVKACRERLAAIIEEEKQAAAARRAAEASARSIGSVAREQEDAAARATKQATVVEDKLAAAKPSDLASVRGDVGAQSSNQMRWTFAIDDFDALPAQFLWRYLTQDEKRAAVSRYVESGERTALAGTRIYQEPVNAVR
jgi:hypothetical protein